MYREDQFLPIVGVQHYLFCPRQCALIFLEQLWVDNYLTASGTVMHDRVHKGPNESRGDIRTVRQLRMRSFRLGLTGIADAVEFHLADAEHPGVKLPHARGRWYPYPVEYKRGRPKRNNCDRAQLCAQAICLEEMLGLTIHEGALFYGETRHRVSVPLDTALRQETEDASRHFHELIESGITPPAQEGPHCKSCSIRELCLPNRLKSAKEYIRRHALEG